MTARRVPPLTAPVLSRALLSGWVMRFPVGRSDLERRLSAYGPLRLSRCESGAGESHTVQCELWLVHEGEIRLGSLGQHDASSFFGAAAGAMIGAAIGAWTAALVPIRSPGARSKRQPPRSAIARGIEVGRSKGSELAENLSRRAATALGTYRECLVSVPDVVLGRDETRHTFVCGMYADSPLARWADQAFGFGYDKRDARFEVMEPGVWSVLDLAGPVLSFRQTGEARSAVDEATLRALDETAAMPLLGLTPTGSFARSWLRRSFQALREVHSVSGVMELRADSLTAAGRRYRLGAPAGTGVAVGFSGMPATVSYPRSVY